MSEKLSHGHHEKLEPAVEAGAEAKDNLERIHKAAENAESLPKTEHVREKVHDEAISGKEVSVEEKPVSENSNFGVERQLKTRAYQKTLHRIQSHLSLPERTFSKVTHNAAIDKASNVAGKTIARPTGILGGSICAFLGSLFLLYISKRYGFTYNYLLFVILFVGGYILGTVVEIGLWILVGRRKQRLS